MNDWDATNYAAKENLLRVAPAGSRRAVRDGEKPVTLDRQRPRARNGKSSDIVGHLIDVTESYFVGFRRGTLRACRSTTRSVSEGNA